MRANILWMAVGALLLAGCGGEPPKQIDYSLMCPAKGMRQVNNTHLAMSEIEVGVTHWKDIKALRKPVRRTTLSHPGADDLTVAFYLNGLPNCPLLVPAPAMFQPVVMDKHGVILGYGLDVMYELHAQGWALKDSAWPWQSYNYAYLPVK